MNLTLLSTIFRPRAIGNRSLAWISGSGLSQSFAEVESHLVTVSTGPQIVRMMLLVKAVSLKDNRLRKIIYAKQTQALTTPPSAIRTKNKCLNTLASLKIIHNKPCNQTRRTLPSMGRTQTRSSTSRFKRTISVPNSSQINCKKRAKLKTNSLPPRTNAILAMVVVQSKWVISLAARTWIKLNPAILNTDS